MLSTNEPLLDNLFGYKYLDKITIWHKSKEKSFFYNNQLILVNFMLCSMLQSKILKVQPKNM